MISNYITDCHISLILKEGSRFPLLMNEFFRQGVQIEILTGTSIREVMVSQLGMDEGYLENHVQTIFLNGKPVDNVDAVRLDENSIVALSAAMPGLAGATLRKSGKYASFRQGISLDDPSAVFASGKKGKMILKLFNQVAAEQGVVVMKKGVCISCQDALRLLWKAQEQSLMPDIETVVINGQSVLSEYLAAAISNSDIIYLSIS